MTTAKTTAKTTAAATAKTTAKTTAAATAKTTAAATAMRKFTPMDDRVVVKPSQAKEELRGGIIIPDTAKEKPQEGEVIAVGLGRVTPEGKRLPMGVKVGDKVLYSKYGGVEIKEQGTEYLVLRESDILAKIG